MVRLWPTFQPTWIYVFDFCISSNVDGDTAKYTFFVGVVTYLWYVFGGDLKVQFAIDVDFPEILISSRLSWIWFAGPFSLFAG